MALTGDGRRLTEQHRRAQLALQAEAMREAAQLWPSLNPYDLPRSGPGWLRRMIDLILGRRRRSALLARDYYQQFRMAELTPRLGPLAQISTPFPPSLTVPDPPEEKLIVSLSVTGPVRIQQHIAKGATPAQAQREALPVMLGATARHVADGGREELDEAVRDDSEALGWARVTDADPCAFCAMLASRGAVYKSRFSAEKSSGRRGNQAFGQPYHDNCGCTAEPVFDRAAALPGRADEFSELWDEATLGKSGKDALNAFRREYEKRQRESREAGSPAAATGPGGPPTEPPTDRGSGAAADEPEDRSELQPHERATVRRLEARGHVVQTQPRRHDQRTADLLVDGVEYEMKSPTGASSDTIPRNVRDARKQSDRVLIDLSRTGLDRDAAVEAARRAAQRYHVTEVRLIHEDGFDLTVTGE